MAKQTTKAEENIQAVEEALGKTEKFIEDNQKPIITVIGILVVLILGIFAAQRYYLKPKEANAQIQIFMAEQYFEQDSLNLALNGDGINPGFIDIIDDYKWTKTANLARYYAGISFLRLGEYDAAIEHLNKFGGDDILLQPLAYGAIGDAYMQLGDQQKAAKQYLKAADHNSNELTTPAFLMKAGWSYEMLGEYKNAVNVYKRIKNNYPTSQEGREIDKNIAYAEGRIK
jgi:tetratricopeptide (TPR) repeat protein